MLTTPAKKQSGLKRIEAERRRQIEVEGWTSAGDAVYSNGELFAAARCYDLLTSEGWPWATSWWKPSHGNRARDLEKAGALYLAERDRLMAEGEMERARLMTRKAREMARRIDAMVTTGVSR
jgi:hypothetical protein